MKTSGLALLTLLALTLPAVAATPQRLYRYQCEGGRTFEATYTVDQVKLTLAGREAITLPQVRSASGVRYSDGKLTLFTKGNDAFIEEDGTPTYSACIGELTQPVRGLW